MLPACCSTYREKERQWEISPVLRVSPGAAAAAHLTDAGHLLLREAEAGQCLASGCGCGAAIAAAAAQVQSAGIEAATQPSTAAAAAQTHAHAHAAAAAASVVRQHIEIIVIIACAIVVVVVVQRNHRPAQPRRTVGRRVPGREHGSRIGRCQIVEICGGMLKHIYLLLSSLLPIRYGAEHLQTRQGSGYVRRVYAESSSMH